MIELAPSVYDFANFSISKVVAAVDSSVGDDRGGWEGAEGICYFFRAPGMLLVDVGDCEVGHDHYYHQDEEEDCPEQAGCLFILVVCVDSGHAG